MAHCVMPQRNVQLSARTPVQHTFAPLPLRRVATVAKGWREEKAAGGDSRLKEEVKAEAEMYRKEAEQQSSKIVSSINNNWADYDNDMMPEERARAAIQSLQERWAQQKDKRTTVVLITGTVLGGLIAGRILDSVNHVPVLPDLFTFIGLAVTSKLFWDYVLFKDGRDRLRSKLSDVYLTFRDAVEADGPIQPSVRNSMSGGESLTDSFSGSSTSTSSSSKNNNNNNNNNNNGDNKNNNSNQKTMGSSGSSGSAGVQDYSAYSTGKANNPLADRGSGPSVKRAIQDEHDEFKTERDEKHGAPGTPYMGVDDEDLEERQKGGASGARTSAKQGGKTAPKKNGNNTKSQDHTADPQMVREEREEIKTERDNKHGAPKTPYLGQDDEDVEVAPASAQVEQSGGGWPWGFGGNNNKNKDKQQQQQQQQQTTASSGSKEGAHGAKGFGYDAAPSSSSSNNNKGHKGSHTKPDGFNSNPDTL